MTHHLTHVQTTVLVVAATIAAGLWTWFWLWIYWMAFRLIRWAYLEKKQNRSSPALPAPEYPPYKRSYRRSQTAQADA